MKKKPEEITEILTSEGIKKLSEGQLLVFTKRVYTKIKIDNYKKGERIIPLGNSLADTQIVKTELKITKISKGRVWAKEIKTYNPDEVAITKRKK